MNTIGAFNPYSHNYGEASHDKLESYNVTKPTKLTRTDFLTTFPQQSINGLSFANLKKAGDSIGECLFNGKKLSQAIIIGHINGGGQLPRLIVYCPAHSLYENGKLKHSPKSLQKKPLTFSHPLLPKSVTMKKILEAEKSSLNDFVIFATSRTKPLNPLDINGLLTYNGPPIALNRNGQDIRYCLGIKQDTTIGETICDSNTYFSEPGDSGSLIIKSRLAMHAYDDSGPAPSKNSYLLENSQVFNACKKRTDLPDTLDIILPERYEVPPFISEERLPPLQVSLYSVLSPLAPPLQDLVLLKKKAFEKYDTAKIANVFKKCLERLPNSGESITILPSKQLKGNFTELEKSIRCCTRNSKYNYNIEHGKRENGGAFTHIIMPNPTSTECMIMAFLSSSITKMSASLIHFEPNDTQNDRAMIIYSKLSEDDVLNNHYLFINKDLENLHIKKLKLMPRRNSENVSKWNNNSKFDLRETNEQHTLFCNDKDTMFRFIELNATSIDKDTPLLEFAHMIQNPNHQFDPILQSIFN